jgi:hypothetical protein
MKASRIGTTPHWFLDSDAGYFTHLISDKAAVRWAMHTVADHGGSVTIYRRGPGLPVHLVAGVLSSGMIWVHLTNERLAAAIGTVEEKG